LPPPLHAEQEHAFRGRQPLGARRAAERAPTQPEPALESHLASDVRQGHDVAPGLEGQHPAAGERLVLVTKDARDVVHVDRRVVFDGLADQPSRVVAREAHEVLRQHRHRRRVARQRLGIVRRAPQRDLVAQQLADLVVRRQRHAEGGRHPLQVGRQLHARTD